MITGTARNGMLYAVRRRQSAVAYCALSIRCGTRDEEGFHPGIAHFTEHTLFKGTTRKRAATINSYLDKLGGELNAYTTKEEIVLHATVLKEDLRKACSLLMELASRPTFPPEEIETERGVVIDEIQSVKDNPADDIFDRFEELLFEGHPLSGLILGTVDSVRRITSEELLRFVRTYFQPQRMAFTVVADVDEVRFGKVIDRLAETFFGAPSAPVPPLAGQAPDDPRHYFLPRARRIDRTEEKKNHEVNVVIGSLAPSLYEAQDRITTILLGNLLAGPASNTILNEVLRERHGWVYGVESAYTQYLDTGSLTISLGCDRDNLEKCLTAIRKEILKLQTVPLTPARLKAAQKQLLGQLAIASDNGEAQCLSMGKSLLAYGRIDPQTEIRRQIEAVTAEDIRTLARRIFHPDRTAKLVYL